VIFSPQQAEQGVSVMAQRIKVAAAALLLAVGWVLIGGSGEATVFAQQTTGKGATVTAPVQSASLAPASEDKAAESKHI
jgi:hypothetical protein